MMSEEKDNNNNNNNNEKEKEEEKEEEEKEKPPLLVIVGASFGGLACWHQLRQLQQEQQKQREQTSPLSLNVLLLDQGHEFTVGGTWQFVWTNRVAATAQTTTTTTTTAGTTTRATTHHDLTKAQLLKTMPNDANQNQNQNWNVRLDTVVTDWEPDKNQIRIRDATSSTATTTATTTTTIEYDALVMACGVKADPDNIPGLENLVNICNYASVQRQQQQVQALLAKADRLQQQQQQNSNHHNDNGKAPKPPKPPTPPPLTFVMAIGATPYKCPPAPFECTFLLEEMLTRHRGRNQVRLIITCPTAWPMPTAFYHTFQRAWQERNVEFLPNYELERVETKTTNTTSTTSTTTTTTTTADHPNQDTSTVLHYKNGKTLHATVVWTTWPLRAPDLVQRALPSTCLQGGFVKVDKATHVVKGHDVNNNNKMMMMDNVHVIGDCCVVPVDSNGLTIPKAGEFAWKMGRSVGSYLWHKYTTTQASSSSSRQPPDHAKGSLLPLVVDRRAACIAEIGHGKGLALVSDLSAFCQGTGKPHFEIVASDTGEEQKVKWVNSYYQIIFGNKDAPILSPIKLKEESVEANVAKPAGSRKRSRDNDGNDMSTKTKT